VWWSGRAHERARVGRGVTMTPAARTPSARGPSALRWPRVGAVRAESEAVEKAGAHLQHGDAKLQPAGRVESTQARKAKLTTHVLEQRIGRLAAHRGRGGAGALVSSRWSQDSVPRKACVAVSSLVGRPFVVNLALFKKIKKIPVQ
jgi:hypothetical protein